MVVFMELLEAIEHLVLQAMDTAGEQKDNLDNFLVSRNLIVKRLFSHTQKVRHSNAAEFFRDEASTPTFGAAPS